ncbi:hypothetical protein HPJ92_01870 [Anoxybacillus flavithermus]|uniref:hypothetical protein n=1 Tax=Anoxybacillus flavithermus TaxID=33934 RepID=UPI001868467C|nr:hypothetical protein [Anoxybacillus flavithermus]MBE2914740.1 hypothetical protein [Anoxybacillus flavithermus]MBE2931306.1 hypothetical protein [Anoxybacillus flavithermus]
MATETNTILLGSGDLFLGVVDPNATEEEIEKALVKIGEISGGATLIYKPDFKEVRGGAKNNVLANFMTSESVTFKTGLCTFDLKNISRLNAANYTEDTKSGTRRVGIGGLRDVPINFLRFVHYKPNNKRLIVNIFKAQNQNGFELNFDAEKETVLDMEFIALATDKKDGNLVEIIEEL